MKIEIYAANLRVGGAVVSAASLIDGLRDLLDESPPTWFEELKIVVSPEVWCNMNQQFVALRGLQCPVVIREDTPLRSMLQAPSWNPDVRYVIFGPDYARRSRGINVAGFADGTLIPAWNASFSSAARASRSAQILSLPRHVVKKRLLSSFDGFVVQSEGMARSLREAFPDRSIAVIPNLLAPAFTRPNLRQLETLPLRKPNEIRLFYPARGWAHKNHELLPQVSRAFLNLYQRQLTFVTTLSPDEHAKVFASSDFGILNVGPVNVSVLPGLYAQTDGLFMPSGNETFSLTPLEASFMRKPMVVSDLPFFREILGDFPVYWDMKSAEGAAQLIYAELVQESEDVSRVSYRLEAAQRWARQHANPQSVATRHIEFLRKMTFAENC
jgi:glycosyltransferase involved in cell wall biosynthesis